MVFYLNKWSCRGKIQTLPSDFQGPAVAHQTLYGAADPLFGQTNSRDPAS